MPQLTPEGTQVVHDLSQKYGFTPDAVTHMLLAVLHGNGSMAQFNHPEFGGSGQWMPGGMLMISDMFNNALKGRVDGLCRDVSAALASQPMPATGASHSFQQQSGAGLQQQRATPPPAPSASPLFVPDPRDSWWPAELGVPSATGEQNSVRYAFFPNRGRLAVDVNGQVNVYDTGGQHIAGFSQQQGGAGVVFSTPGGTISLSSFSPAGGLGQQQQSGGGSQQQSSGGGLQQQNTAMAPMGSMPPMGSMAPMGSMPPMQQQRWWPPELGLPASSGAQNDLRYALFPAAGLLAVDRGGRCRVFELGDQPVNGVFVGSATGELVLSTPDGERPLSQFPEVSAAGQAVSAPATQSTATAATSGGQDDPYAALERLGELKAKGILTEEEFSRKKAELLARL